MFEVLLYGNPVLRMQAEPVKIFGKKLRQFAEEMVETMVVKDGLGLAAPQVGKAVRLIVVDDSRGEKPARVLINPELTWLSDEKVEIEEGCLSVPEIHIKIFRPASISVKAKDVEGSEFIIDKATDMLARVIQHEIDHLNGKMIVDYASPLQRQLLNARLKKMAKAPKEPQPA
jgi:peptide deformylase